MRLNKNLKNLLAKTIRQTLTPAPRLPLSEWANEHRYIGVGAGPLPGPFRWQVAPYQKGMLDAAGDPKCERVVFCCATQVGKTSIVENIIAFYMASDPSPVMMVLPNQRDAEIFSTTRLDTMISDSECLKHLIKNKNRKDSGDTRLQKRFSGGSVELVSSKSSSGLRGRSIRVMLLDEVDAYEMGTEGDVISRAEKRTSTFWNRKIILTSTPTDVQVSRIWSEFLNGDQRYYYIHCPYCNYPQVFSFKQFKFPEKSAQFVYYECVNENCKKEIEEYHKHSMLLNGFWKANAPENDYPSFHLNALYSPWKKWKEIAKEWLASEDNIQLRKVFINTVLAEPWKDDKPETSVDELMVNCIPYDAEVPSGVGVLVAGVDVQKDRLEMYVWGCGIGENWWLIEDHYIYSDPSKDETWQQLTDYIRKSYKTANGKTIQLSAVCVDTGYASDLVYRYVKNYHNSNILAVKGSSFAHARLLARGGQNKNRDVPVYFVGTDTAKDQIAMGFKNSGTSRRFFFPGISPLHPQGTQREIFEQLVSERKITKYKNNAPYEVWQKINPNGRNEALDCLVYSLAALAHLNVYNRLEILAREYMQDGSLPVIANSGSITVTPFISPPPVVRQMPKFKYEPKYYGKNRW